MSTNDQPSKPPTNAERVDLVYRAYLTAYAEARAPAVTKVFPYEYGTTSLLAFTLGVATATSGPPVMSREDFVELLERTGGEPLGFVQRWGMRPGDIVVSLSSDMDPAEVVKRVNEMLDRWWEHALSGAAGVDFRPGPADPSIDKPAAPTVQ
jgi:hypothetical protein